MKFEFRYENLKSKFSVIFLSTIWLLDALERIEKIIPENAFEKKKPGLKFNRGLALPAFQQLGLGEERFFCSF